MILAAGTAAGQSFDGVDDASRPVMEQARQRIEAIRKGDFRVRLVDNVGKPVSGSASVRLTRHAFRFGVSAYGVPRLAEAARRQTLEVMDELFNTVTIANYWHENEPTRNGERNWKDSDWMVEWATAHGKTMRFHAMFYLWPKWATEVEDTAEWWRIMDARVRAVAERYGKRIHEYDILNEVASRAWVWNKEKDPLRDSLVFPHFVETANGARCFEIARRYLPDAELVDNDQAVATPSNDAVNLHLKYNRALLAAGAPIDVFGQQAHFFASGQMPFQEGHAAAGKGAFTMAMLDQGFDCMGSLGKPVHITEFSPPSRDKTRTGPQPRLSDEEVAAWQVNYYMLAFSKPFVHEITRWFVVDELGGRGMDAGVITKDGKLKPSYYALRKLINQTWSTSWKGAVRSGEVAFRGFYGEYEVVMPGYRPARFSAQPGASEPVVVERSRP
jgi:GH35 family endo-1,4-beta-xylanase